MPKDEKQPGEEKRPKPDDDLETRITLIESAKRNEPEAWQLVLSLYSPLISYWAWNKGVTCPHEQENVIQEVFRRVFNKLDSFTKKDGQGSFRGWLRTITNNFIYSNQLGNARLKTIGGSDWQHYLNEIPRNEPEVGSLLDSVNDDASGYVETGLIFRMIMNWVKNEYSPTQTSAFTSVVIHQRPARDVAQDLEISVNMVYQNKCRILARIRQVFKDIM